jgi:hypothetical protein
MPFDDKFKEGARANDAVDRLREVKAKLKEEEERRERQTDAIVKGVLLALVAIIVGYAIVKL